MHNLHNTDPFKKQHVDADQDDSFEGVIRRLLIEDPAFLRAATEMALSAPAVDGTPFDLGELRALLTRLPLPSPAERAEAERLHLESAVRGLPLSRRVTVETTLAVLRETFGRGDA